jgi:glycosyltransferase involved in cell wall biosynthesis
VGAGRDRTPPRSKIRVLWIGRFSPEKRFELALELAARAPELHLDVVGGRAGKAGYAEALERRARALPNVCLHGWVPHDRIGGYYDSAHVLLCTSAVEGFPNTFLEAWARGTPTVSTVDPDGLIAHEGLGAVADDAERLHEALGWLLREPRRWTDASQRARRRFLEHHIPSRAGDTYETLLHDLVARGSGGPTRRSGRARAERDHGAIAQEEARPRSPRVSLLEGALEAPQRTVDPPRPGGYHLSSL